MKFLADVRSATVPTKEMAESKYPDLPIPAFEARVLRYLCWFGLMEKAQPAANDDWRQPWLYRKTALYDRVLRLRMPTREPALTSAPESDRG